MPAGYAAQNKTQQFVAGKFLANAHQARKKTTHDLMESSSEQQEFYRLYARHCTAVS
jgi:hypothetical protein